MDYSKKLKIHRRFVELRDKDMAANKISWLQYPLGACFRFEWIYSDNWYIIFQLKMAIDPEVIPPSSNKGSRAGRYIPKWAIYSSVGVGVLALVALIKTLLPLIGMAFLLAFIWAQSSTNRRYWEFCSPIIKVFPQMDFDLSPDNEMVNRGNSSIENVNNKN